MYGYSKRESSTKYLNILRVNVLLIWIFFMHSKKIKPYIIRTATYNKNCYIQYNNSFFVSFTEIDANVTCRHLGFLKGNFTYHSFARNLTDYILWEKPDCRGAENNLFDCPGANSIRIGRHICGMNTYFLFIFI